MQAELHTLEHVPGDVSPIDNAPHLGILLEGKGVHVLLGKDLSIGCRAVSEPSGANGSPLDVLGVVMLSQDRFGFVHVAQAH